MSLAIGDVLAGLVVLLVLEVAAVAVVLTLCVALVALAASGGYRPRLTYSALDDLPGVLGGTLTGGVLGLGLAALVVDAGLKPVGAGFFIALTVWPFLSTVWRSSCHGIAGRVHRRRPRPSVLLGAGQVAARVADTVAHHPEFGMEIVGFLDADDADDPRADRDPVLDRRPAALVGVARLGTIGELPDVVRERRVERVIITFSSMRESDIVLALRQCDELDCEIYVVPRLFELFKGAPGEHLWGIPVHRLVRPSFRSPWRHVKRIVDLLAAAVLLVPAAPVMALCLVVAHRETGGWFFGQERVGRGGAPFRVLKIQTLKPRDDGESRTQWNIATDERLGPVGHFLRRTSLDELPQLWNILRGDMSLVGPRPERPYFVQQFSATMPHYSARNRVRAGLTGWAQVHDLRGDTSVSDRAVFDNYYIEHWSLWGDVKIGLRTVGAVVRGAGG